MRDTDNTDGIWYLPQSDLQRLLDMSTPRHILDVIDYWGTQHPPIPFGSARDTELAAAVAASARLSSTERQELLDGMLVREPGRLARLRVEVMRWFTVRAATLAVRTQDIQWVIRGLDALAMDDFRDDWKESMLLLPLLYRSAQLLGTDPDQLLEEAASRALPNAAIHYREYISREAEQKQVGTMGYIERDGPDGFEYLRTW
jgi:hypothetical protein